MPLSVGDKLGPYEILAQIGAGGMGEVYKACDTRLDRFVAIKVSKTEFTERFEREARAVAALNHPNICTLHDVGSNFLVMEFVEGASPKGPLPLDEVLRLAKQIAAALAEAHEKHITHRDLKPGNIMIKPDGSVKVLDFGLAKLAPPARTDLSPENSPTLTMAATEIGLVLGTAAYMAPEQAKGIAVDKRADIWAFGVVLYELTTGRRPFHGNDISEILASVIKEHPAYDDVPHQLKRLIQRCLEKDPAKRLRDIGDVWDLIDGPPAPPPEPVIAAPPSKKSWLPWGAAAVLALATAGLGWLYFLQPAPPAPSVVRFNIPMPEKSVVTNNIALSPDGRSIAFRDGAGRMWVHSFDSLESRLLQGAEGAGTVPFWSYDSRTLVFSVQSKLKKISVNGGPPTTLADIPAGVTGGFWTADNRIVFGTARSGLLMVPSGGGTPSPVTQLEAGASSHQMPALLPDGKHFLYLRRSSNPDLTGIFAGSLDDKPDKQSSQRLLPDQSSVYYAGPSVASPSGHVVFYRESTLMAQPFDAGHLQLSGDAVPIAQGVSALGGFYLSATGALAYTTSGGHNRQLAWFDRKGLRVGNVWNPGPFFELELSPDDTRVAAVRDGANSNSVVWVYEFARNAETLITTASGPAAHPLWIDGQRLVYYSGARFFTRAASGAGPEQLFAELDPGIQTPYPQTVSPDGRTLLYEPGVPKTGRDLMMLPIENGKAGKMSAYLNSEANESQAQFSPDGRYVAYHLTQAGRNEIQVSTFPDPGKGRWTISSGGGFQPRWRKDGKELFYFGAGGKLMSLDVSLSPKFNASAPKLLFEAPIYGGGATPSQIRWDVSRDGQRFLINTSIGDESATPITVVLNWQAAHKKP